MKPTPITTMKAIPGNKKSMGSLKINTIATKRASCKAIMRFEILKKRKSSMANTNADKAKSI